MKHWGIVLSRHLAGMVAAALWASAQAGVMSLDGQLTVSESGAAIYSIPLQVPPGIAGMEPKLALSYNSQGGNGLAGMRWAIGGLSAITRCPRTIAQDGERGSVRFDDKDRFCLDGQRLMSIAGGYGQDGAEYRTERESFSRIVSYGTAGSGPRWFRVWTKAGLIIDYGNTADSRIEAAKGSNNPSWAPGTVSVWAVNRMADTKGNYLNNFYQNWPDRGAFFLRKVDYTGNTTTGQAPGNSVQFEYEDRPDSAPAYHAGAKTEMPVRLTKIRTYQGPTQVKTYELTYAGGSNPIMPSNLRLVQECSGGADPRCLPPIEFTWSERSNGTLKWGPRESPGSIDLQAQVFGSSENYENTIPGDFNGDGKTDLLRYHTVNWENNEIFLGRGDGTFRRAPKGSPGSIDLGEWWFGLRDNDGGSIPGDFNGDGRTDILRWHGENTALNRVFLANSDGTLNPAPQSTGDVDTGNTWFESDGSFWTSLAGDFNGDGRTDILRSDIHKSANRVFLAKGDGTFAAAPTAEPGSIDLTQYQLRSGHGEVVLLLADFNGDGKTDILQTDSVGDPGVRLNRLFLARGNGTFDEASLATDGDGDTLRKWPLNHNNFWRSVAGDFNGDGKADILRVTTDPSLNRVFLSNGDGSFIAALLSSERSINLSDVLMKHEEDVLGIELADFNGDGRADILRWHKVEPSLNKIFLSNGDGTFWPAPTQEDGSMDLTTLAFYSVGGRMGSALGDYDGDGKTDILRWNEVRENNRMLLGRYLNAGNLLLSIKTGLGAETRIFHRPLTDEEVYTKLDISTYPVIDLQTPMYVVSSVTTDNGKGGQLRTDYHYGGLRASVNGRGLFGFKWIEAKQNDTNISSYTEFRQDRPYTGLPSLIRRSQPGSGKAGVLSETTYAYACLEPKDGRDCSVEPGDNYFPYVSQSVEESWDANGAPFPTVTTRNQFDRFGNPTQIEVRTDDGFKKTTDNRYDNDPDKWILGRLNRSQVTSETP